MSRRTAQPDALPMFVEGCDDPAMPGRVAVHTGETPGATRVLETEQVDLFDALDDELSTPAAAAPTTTEHAWECAMADGWRQCGSWCPADDPAGCAGCGTPTDPLALFPGGICLTCYRPEGDRIAATMTADSLARMWGAR